MKRIISYLLIAAIVFTIMPTGTVKAATSSSVLETGKGISKKDLKKSRKPFIWRFSAQKT